VIQGRNRSEYYKRVNRALDPIRQHRTAPLTLDALADVAGFSRFHFHRDLWTSERVCLGIGLDNPHVTDPALCRYDAAIVVPEAFVVDGDASVMLVDGGSVPLPCSRWAARASPGPTTSSSGAGCPTAAISPTTACCSSGYLGDLESATGQVQVCVPIRPL